MKKRKDVRKYKQRKIFLLIFITSLLICIPLFYSQFSKEKKEKEQEIEEEIVKKAVVAGQFYPSEKKILDEMVNSYIENAKERKISGNICGLIAPHAGYIFSGKVAAFGYKELIGSEYETVFILGPSHYSWFNGAAILNATTYETPLGKVKISKKAREMLKNEREIFVVNDAAFLREHSVEVQIPFLQKVLKNFTIVPIVVSNVEPKELADALMKYIGDNSLVIASSDLSHYYSYEKALDLDRKCIDAVISMDFSKIDQCEACGKIPVITLMYIAKEKNWNAMLLNYNNSGDTYGDRSRVVGYASIVFYRNESDSINENDKKFLLNLARKTLESYLSTGIKPYINETEISENLKMKQGCFVTLKKSDQLRGCIGHILPQVPLYECVIENAINAALHDPRFTEVRYDELKDIKIEISVLSLPKILQYSFDEDLLNKLTPYEDGVVLKFGSRQSTYLPQVWEQIPDKKIFLSSLCLKGGMPEDCWRKGVEVYTYKAEVFSEE
ncbi:MAG: AmmeMemoRadiSam system protein B [Candidatus Altiarchaeota archaeon]